MGNVTFVLRRVACDPIPSIGLPPFVGVTALDEHILQHFINAYRITQGRDHSEAEVRCQMGFLKVSGVSRDHWMDRELIRIVCVFIARSKW